MLTTLQLIVNPNKVTLQTTEQAINQVIMLKQFVNSVNPVFEALTSTASNMLNNIREVRWHLPAACISFYSQRALALRSGECSTRARAHRLCHQRGHHIC